MKLTINDKAEVLVELGMVRLTQFDAQKRVTGADVAARNLDTAQVRFTRANGVLSVPTCRHASRDGAAHDHACEGHSYGHVCYHARAGLMMAAAVSGAVVTFHESENEARMIGGTGVPVMVPGFVKKAVFASYRPAAKKVERKARKPRDLEAEQAEAEARAEAEAERRAERWREDQAELEYNRQRYND